MIDCPNCHHHNTAGSAFCAECGVSLLAADPLTTQKMQPEHAAAVAAPKRPPPIPVVAPGDNWVTLHLLESGDLLPLTERNEFTLGRSTEGQPILPDVDLAPYQAYTRGVSRLHALIKRGIDDVVLVDLQSGNGTFVNGKRLVPDEECVLSNGDVVSLGGLKIQVLLNSS